MTLRTTDGKAIEIVESKGRGSLSVRYRITRDSYNRFMKSFLNTDFCSGNASRDINKNEIKVCEHLSESSELRDKYLSYRGYCEIEDMLCVMFEDLGDGNSLEEFINVKDDFGEKLPKDPEEREKEFEKRKKDVKVEDIKRLSLEEIVDSAKQLAEQLDDMHSYDYDDEHQGIIHMDINPSNIMILERGGRKRAVLVDYGLARAKGRDIFKLYNLVKPEGVAGTYYGSSADDPLHNTIYCAPNLFVKDEHGALHSDSYEKAEPSLDTYNLCNIFCLMLTGKLSEYWRAQGDCREEIAKNIADGWDMERAELLSDIVAKGTSPDKGSRYKTAAELLGEISSVQEQLDLFVPEVTGPVLEFEPYDTFLGQDFGQPNYESVFGTFLTDDAVFSLEDEEKEYERMLFDASALYPTSKKKKVTAAAPVTGKTKKKVPAPRKATPKRKTVPTKKPAKKKSSSWLGKVVFGLGLLGAAYAIPNAIYDYFDKPPGEVKLESSKGASLSGSTTIKMSAQDDGLNPGIERIILKEDGKPIFEGGGRLGSEFKKDFPVKKGYTGKKDSHTYVLEVIDKAGNSTTSPPLVLNFFVDKIPIVKLTDTHQDSDFTRRKIELEAVDEGYNSGLEKIILYDGEKRIFEKEGQLGDTFKVSLEFCLGKKGKCNKVKQGSHKYLAEVVDKEGNVGRSNLLAIDYDPAPSVSLKPENYRTNGTKTWLSINVKDTGYNAGLSEVNLMQDRKVLHKFDPKGKESFKKNVFLSIYDRKGATKVTEGTHKYYVMVRDKIGNTNSTRERKIHFYNVVPKIESVTCKPYVAVDNRHKSVCKVVASDDYAVRRCKVTSRTGRRKYADLDISGVHSEVAFRFSPKKFCSEPFCNKRISVVCYDNENAESEREKVRIRIKPTLYAEFPSESHCTSNQSYRLLIRIFTKGNLYADSAVRAYPSILKGTKLPKKWKVDGSSIRGRCPFTKRDYITALEFTVGLEGERFAYSHMLEVRKKRPKAMRLEDADHLERCFEKDGQYAAEFSRYYEGYMTSVLYSVVKLKQPGKDSWEERYRYELLPRASEISKGSAQIVSCLALGSPLRVNDYEESHGRCEELRLNTKSSRRLKDNERKLLSFKFNDGGLPELGYEAGKHYKVKDGHIHPVSFVDALVTTLGPTPLCGWHRHGSPLADPNVNGGSQNDPPKTNY